MTTELPSGLRFYRSELRDAIESISTARRGVDAFLRVGFDSQFRHGVTHLAAGGAAGR